MGTCRFFGGSAEGAMCISWWQVGIVSQADGITSHTCSMDVPFTSPAGREGLSPGLRESALTLAIQTYSKAGIVWAKCYTRGKASCAWLLRLIVLNSLCKSGMGWVKFCGLSHFAPTHRVAGGGQPNNHCTWCLYFFICQTSLFMIQASVVFSSSLGIWTGLSNFDFLSSVNI